MKKETILFSGRFDKPELGHIVTIGHLLEEYENVVVCVLDFPNSNWPLSYRVKVLNDCLRIIKRGENAVVVKNETHFGKITQNQISNTLPDFDVYGAGNNSVLKHLESIGVKCVYVPRYMDYAATPGRVYDKIVEIINSEKG